MTRKPALDGATLRRIERAHYRLQASLYMRERRDSSGVCLFNAPDIPEPEWCHAGLVRFDPAHLAARLSEIRCFYKERSLPPTVAVSPFTEPADLAQRLRDLGFEPSFRHSWIVATHTSPPELEMPAGVEIRCIDDVRRMHAGISVFEGVYSAAEWGDPLPPGYAQALWASFRWPGRCRVVHYLATVDGTPAGFATSLHLEAVCGMYNLSVLPAFQRRGLGRALTARRVADAMRLGQRLIFAVTEREWVEQWHRRHDFELGFVTTGYTTA